MADAISVSAPISGTDRTLSFETGKLAGQADGAVLGRIGDTMILVTATASKGVREGTDFFPLTVDIEERMYAVGKIPGSFFRREGKAPDQAILTDRLIDRPLRPSFPEGFRNEVHVVGTVLGSDLENPHDVLAINGASAALMLSGIPFDGPIGAVRVAWSQEGTWIPHATYQEGDESCFELVVAGRALSEDADAEIAIMMVEAGGTEKSWGFYEAGTPRVTEEVLAQGLESAKTWIRESIVLQRELVAKAGKKPPITYTLFTDYESDVYERVSASGSDLITKANSITEKADRNAALDGATQSIMADLESEFPDRGREVKAAVRSLTKKIVRTRIVEEGIRIDGRGTSDLRPLSAEVDLIPTAHGTGLFQRGETQVLNITTLGMPRMNQMLDTIGTDEFKRYMHHYNFPPFSTGETGFMRGPKRREIGHGLLAERALLPVVPLQEEFPYTLRLVSEVLSSNGSTSMASVCGSSLSLMDAGVPIKAPVAGIAMGLVFDSGRYVTLTDILGAEDAFGDMDFKVAGTSDTITALQLDTKIDGLPSDVLSQALNQARDARLKILEVMAGAISGPRPEVADNAPKIVSFQIPVDRIGEVIGPKGKVINTLQAETGADITVDDDGMFGLVTIGAKDSSAVDEARKRIFLIVEPPEADVGGVYPGKVVNITKFGAFVNILPGRDGLLHISKIGGGKRVDRVEDVLSLGQELEVKVDDIDPQGKVSLSLVGEPPAPTGGGAPSSSSDRGSDRGGDRDRDREPVEAVDRRGQRPHRRPRSNRLSKPSSPPSSVTSDRPRSPAPATVSGATIVGPGAPGVGDRRRSDAVNPPSGQEVIRTEVLDCGIRLVTEPMTDVRSVTVGVWVGTGSRDEDEARSGASHFLEHLLFKGTATWSAADIAEAVDEVGGDMNAFTTKEYTAFYIRLLSEDLPLGLDVLGAIMTDPALRPEDIEAERQVILDEILMHADEPSDLAAEQCTGAMFPDHPLGREVLGAPASVSALDAPAIRCFFDTHYRTGNLVLSAAGDLDHGALAAEVERRFAGRSGGGAPTRQAPTAPGKPLVVTKRPTEQVHLVVGLRAPGRRSDDRWALAILNHVLGGGIASRLFQEVREKRGLAYSIWSERTQYDEIGSLDVSVGTAPEHAHEVLELVHGELDRLGQSGITARELAVARGHLRAETVLSLEDSGARMSRVGSSLLLHGHVLEVDDLLARVDAVTVDDVATVAAALASEPRTLSVVGPFDRHDFET